MMRNKSKRHFFSSISFRLIVMFLSVILMIMFINIYIYYNVNSIVSNMNQVYEKNFVLNTITDELGMIQKSMTEYLENKNTDSMQNYYKHVQDYQHILDSLNIDTTNNNDMLMEKNIYNISQEYIILTDKCIAYKRGRDIVNYRRTHQETTKIHMYLSDYIDSLNSSLFVTNSSNYRIIVNVLNNTEQLSIGILCVALLFTILLIMYATNKITSPLKRLAHAANKVAEGELDIEPVVITSEDEVGVVTRAFNQMLSSIREYIEHIKINMEKERIMQEKELLMDTHLKEAQLNYLQAQVNPHFLFNTLNAGAQLAMMEEADRTYAYIQNVADFYRYNVSSNRSVTLKEEIELVDNYIYIINVRYSGDIHYSKHVDMNLSSVIVPTMILQPIVENSVKHGVRDIERRAEVSVYVESDGEFVHVRVKDNGLGIEQDVIEDIMSAENRVYNSGQHDDNNGVGLKNVLTRMRLFYDIENVMDIYSEGKDMGTEIVLHIPYNGGNYVQDNDC